MQITTVQKSTKDSSAFLGVSKSTTLILNKLVSHTKYSMKYDIVWFPDIFQSHFCVVVKTVQKEKITKRTGI